jgi:hypothetical protein
MSLLRKEKGGDESGGTRWTHGRSIVAEKENGSNFVLVLVVMHRTIVVP